MIQKKYKLPSEPLTPGVRPLKKRDISKACLLLGNYLKQFHISAHFDEQEFAYWFLPREGLCFFVYLFVLFCFVLFYLFILFIYLFIYLLLYSFIHSFIYSFIYYYYCSIIIIIFFFCIAQEENLGEGCALLRNHPI